MEPITLPETGLPEDPTEPIPDDDPLRKQKRRCQELRLEVSEIIHRISVFGVTPNIMANQQQLQIGAIMRYLCIDQRSRLEFEECYLQELVMMLQKAEEEAPRAVLLQRPADLHP